MGKYQTCLIFHRLSPTGRELTTDHVNIGPDPPEMLSYQQAPVEHLHKALAHILQRELYTMGNSDLLRHKAEMTHPQPHLGDSRCQQLRSSPFWPSPLFWSQLVKDPEEFLLKKGTPKDKPFCGPHNKKRGSYRKRPYGGQSIPSSNQSFSSGRGKSNNRGSRGRFQPHSRGQGHGPPPPTTP